MWKLQGRQPTSRLLGGECLEYMQKYKVEGKPRPLDIIKIDAQVVTPNRDTEYKKRGSNTFIREHRENNRNVESSTFIGEKNHREGSCNLRNHICRRSSTQRPPRA
eukprot:jgi/Bigna1/146355/aug1.113_g21063